MNIGRLLTKRYPSRNAAPTKSDAVVRPDFLCVGAQKAGTSWLYHQLNSHPDFWMPPIKELGYFDQMSHSRHPDSWCKAPSRDKRDHFFFAGMESLCSTPFIDRERYGRLSCAENHLYRARSGGTCMVRSLDGGAQRWLVTFRFSES